MSSRLGTLLDAVWDLAGHNRVRRQLERHSPGATIRRTVELRSPERLVLGRGVFVDSGVVLHCGGMEWSHADGGISLGANTYIGPNSVLFGAGGIEIGEAVMISPGVVITSHQHTVRRADVDIRDQPTEFVKVVIERNVWIGANATILPGLRLGEGCVVGAGAVVTHDVPRRSIVAGVPARVTGER